MAISVGLDYAAGDAVIVMDANSWGRYKWFWMLLIGLIAVLFALLQLFSDASGLSPFTYTLY